MPAGQIQWLLLSQNIGAIECDTEEVSAENKKYTAEWVQSVKDHVVAEESRHRRPIDVMVLHLQEVGGKKFNRAFIAYLGACIHGCFPYAGGWSSGLLMPDEDDGTFTAMASIIFVSPRILDVCSILSFRHRVFIALKDHPVQWVKNRRSLFHGAKFSESGTSRKGYLLTTMRIGSKVFNFVNVHLFHDADNAIAAKQSPSEYALKRQEAIVEAINEISPVVHPDDPLFFFGDFNFRLDISRFVSSMQHRFSQPITMGKKKIAAPDTVWCYLQDPANWDEVRSFDSEGTGATQRAREATGTLLSELPRSFGPTYLIETEPEQIERNRTTVADGGTVVFQRDRLPAWCDRVWLNDRAAAVLSNASYWTAPLRAMDHIPVQLAFGTLL